MANNDWKPLPCNATGPHTDTMCVCGDTIRPRRTCSRPCRWRDGSTLNRTCGSGKELKAGSTDAPGQAPWRHPHPDRELAAFLEDVCEEFGKEAGTRAAVSRSHSRSHSRNQAVLHSHSHSHSHSR
eukprot:7920850-Pyramimonas_sp.AAC.1